ncbi:RHS repeat-associated core domain-containing protein [Luteibacter sp. UNC138MFCol5.1]|nr:RHS repeat-associated core domain-containing protein [Luteibacter sp. UNC138MFCol5.1]
MVLAYDRDGNVISDGRGRTFGWDSAGRLDTVMEATGTSEYRHGPGGRICAIARDGCVTYRYHEDGALAAEVTASDDGRSIPEERRYVRAGRALVAETRLAAAIRETWLLGCDTQGTVLVESGGDAVRTRTYGAFGHRDATGDGARSGFTGTAIDGASGCYFLGDRLYSPTLRRFLNPDPISPFGGGGLNRYGYCGGDPVNRIDPTGNSWVSTFFTVLGLVGAVVGAAASIIALPGVLAAAATTPSMVMATSAVVMETVSVVAEGGSLIAQATGSEELATIFGAAALATGLASAGLGLLPKALAKSSKFMKGAAQASGSHGNAGQRSVVLGAGPSSQATPPREIARLAPDEIDMRRVEIVNGTRIVVDPIVHSVKHPGNARSLHYLMDSAVKSDGLTDGIALAIATQPRSKGKQVVYFYTGIHGNEFGMNTIGNRFATPDPTFGDTLPQADFNTVKRLQAQLGSGYKVKVRSLARVDPATYHSYLSRPGHHVHYFCFSLVDEGLVSVLKIPPDLPISIL